MFIREAVVWMLTIAHCQVFYGSMMSSFSHHQTTHSPLSLQVFHSISTLQYDSKTIDFMSIPS